MTENYTNRIIWGTHSNGTVRYFLKHTKLSENNAQNEDTTYSTWPKPLKHIYFLKVQIPRVSTSATLFIAKKITTR